MKQRGFSLIELVIVMAILAILLIISMMSWRRQMEKARDAQRKEDLQRISLAFEEYFSDFGCYPAADILNNCGGEELKPYLDKIPCDPASGEPYQYIVDEDNPACYEDYRILAMMSNEDDLAIAGLGCNSELGCGYDGSYNFGVSSKNVAVTSPTLPSPGPSASPGASASPEVSPQPSASPISGNYWCQTTGNCTAYDPALWSCTPNYADPNCTGSNGCASGGSCTRL